MSQQQSQFHEDGPSERPYDSQYYQPPVQRELNNDPREQAGYPQDYHYDPHAQGEKLRPMASPPRPHSSRKYWVAIVIGLILFMGMMSSHFAATGYGPISSPHFGPYHMGDKPGGAGPAKMQEYKGSILNLQAIDANLHVHVGDSSNVQVNTVGPASLNGKSDGTTITLDQTNAGGDIFGNGNKDIDIAVPANMDMNIETTSGRVEINGVTGKVNISAVSADIQIDQTTLASGSSLETKSGYIHFNSNLAEKGTTTFTTVSGDVQVGLPASESAKVTTNTVSGAVHKGDNGSVTSSSPELIIATVSGDINVDYHK